MPRQVRVPTYRFHKGSGQAVVVLDGKSVYLGVWNTPESRAAYDKIIAEWLANHRRLPPAARGPYTANPPPVNELSINELILAFWRHAEAYYKPDGDSTSELRCIREALRPLRELYGNTLAVEFGPLALKAVRQKMIDKGWCRSHINHQVGRLRRMFRWGVAEELLPSAVYEALRAVPGLPKGRGGVRETQRVRPATWEQLEAVWPLCPRPVAAMLRLQWWSGMRSCEVRIMRTADIDRGNPACWTYRPMRHKNDWRGNDQERVIPLGKECQLILNEWLRPDEPDAFLFQPRQAVAERNARRRAERRTPMTPSQRSRKPKKKPRRAPGGCYTAMSYAQAVARACEKAGVEFHPYMLRHACKMRLERAAGVDAARAVLGQRSIQATQHYGGLDLAKAVEVMTHHG
jgi:integrase